MADTDFPQPSSVEPRKRRFSWVWLMPLLAVAISAAVVWQTWRDQGPVIIVTFPIASGIESGQTPLRFRDVQVGLVEDVGFDDSLQSVEAHIRIDNEIAPYVDASAEFWLVQPEVSARGVSGLSTVLEGVYIEVVLDGEIGETETRFIARDETPLALPGEAGTTVLLRTREGGQLAAGAPVLFNGIEVGRLGVPELSEDGTIVSMEAFIEAPHDQRLSTTTRFWDISGISIDLNSSGLSVSFESLASLIEGGVAFGSLVTGGEPIADGEVFTVFPSLEAARQSVFEAPSERALELSVIVPANEVRLVLGANVRYGGVRVGEVIDITGYTDPRSPEEGVQILVTFTVTPARIGLPDVADPQELIPLLAERVEEGLRARVASEGLLGTSTVIELIEDEDGTALTGRLNTTLLDTPLLPTGEANVVEASANIDAVVTRISALPIEELMASAIDALDGIAAIAAGDDLQALPGNVNELVTEARALVTAEEINTTLADLATAAGDLSDLVIRIATSEGLDTTLTALQGTQNVFDSVLTFTDGLPAVLTSVNSLLAELQSVPVTEVANSADSLLQRIETILEGEAAENIPTSLNTALTEIATLVEEVRDAGTVESLGGAIDGADSALGAIETAATDLSALVAEIAESEGLTTTLAALEETDSIVASVNALLADLQSAPVTEVATSADRLLRRVETILEGEDAEELPETLNTTLTELATILGELREGGAAENLVSTLNSADSAFGAIQEAAAQVPTIVSRLDGLVLSLQALTGDYNEDSPVYRDLRSAIAEITRTADAFRTLAREIERSPNSLIFGR